VISIFLLLGSFSVAYRLLYDHGEDEKTLQKENFDIILANDVETLPLAFRISNGRSKVFLDAHEYAPRQFEDRLYWRIFFKRFTMHICRKYIPLTAGMSTINSGLARAYEREFSVKPIIITNATNFVNVRPKVREAYPIRLVHHGIFTISRQPHLMIEVMNLLDDRFTLDLIYLLPDSASGKTKAYFESFKTKALASGKIKVRPPLRGDQIVSTINQNYDMGIILVPPVNFNYENGLPNKLFDCIQARLGMAVGPLQEIAKITTDYGIGVVCDDFSPQSMADALRSLTLEDVSRFKQNANVAAAKMNAEFNKTILLDHFNKIT
jgi:hypothetical protein